MGQVISVIFCSSIPSFSTAGRQINRVCNPNDLYRFILNYLINVSGDHVLFNSVYLKLLDAKINAFTYFDAILTVYFCTVGRKATKKDQKLCF